LLKARRMKTGSLLLSCTILSCSLASACSDDLVVETGTPVVQSASVTALDFVAVEDENLEPPSASPETLVFRSATEFRAHFGHDATDVDWSAEWVVYYSAGFLMSDGHVASLASLAYDAEAQRLDVVTRLESPGPGCDSFALPELPFTLVKFDLPGEKPELVHVDKDDVLRDCTTVLPGEPIAEDCGVRSGGAFVTIENAGEASERFTAWITDATFIEEAKRLLRDGEQRVPTFKVLDHTDCDGRWSFHLDAARASWNDFTIEVCDAVPSYIHHHKTDWLASNVGWCPWSARVVEVEDRR
jgi:hypothetical protein